jgi:predicted Zn-dependent protease
MERCLTGGGAQPAEGKHAPHGPVLRFAFRSFLALSVAVVSGCSTVPYTGRHNLILISAKEEAKMGEEAYEQTLKEARLSTDTVKLEMLRRVGERLAKAAERPDFDWEFNLIQKDKVVNAFCLPGGKIAVYTGLLPISKDETGLAVVVGHEIAHALARHGAERMSQQMMIQFGGRVLGALTGAQSAVARDLYGQAYGLGASLGVALPHSRSQEAEADHIGLILMAKAGYDPRQALDFWKRMESSGAGKDDPISRFTSTHPSDKRRIQNLEKELPEALKHYNP